MRSSQSESIEGLGLRSDPVRLKPGVDLTALALSAEEGFLISRIGPGETVGSLLVASGLPEPEAVALLHSLVAKGIVEGPSAVETAPEGIESFDFDPEVLAEPVDLDASVKKDLLYREAMGERWHHYDVLGVRPRSSEEEIRKAYFDLMRRYHPDRFFGKHLGSYRERLDRVVERIRRAYEVLSDPEAKARYDRETEIPLTAEELAELQAEQTRRLREERRKLERRERLRRRMPIADRKRKATEFAKEARVAAEKEDWLRAAGLYRLALAYDPNNEAIEALLEEADALAASAKAEELLSRARSAEALGNLDEAERYFREAVEADPANARTLLLLLRFLLARGTKADSVVDMARKVTYLDRHSVEGWTLYGQLLLECGERAKAKKAFEQAVDLDETADEAKEALKKLRWTLF